MGIEERIAALEEENEKLKDDIRMLLMIISQMKTTMNRMISCYVTENR